MCHVAFGDVYRCTTPRSIHITAYALNSISVLVFIIMIQLGWLSPRRARPDKVSLLSLATVPTIDTISISDKATCHCCRGIFNVRQTTTTGFVLSSGLTPAKFDV